MRKSREDKIFALIAYPTLLVLSIISLLPFVIIISSSFTSEQSIIQNGYSIFPHDFSTEAYQMILRNPAEIGRAYGVTLFVTVAGTFLGLFLSSMAAYVLSRKNFAWHGQFSFFFYFTTLFSGGLVPWYILCVQYLKFKQFPLLALIVPSLFSVWNIFLLRNFMKSIPESIVESAKMDGAGDFMVYIRFVMPLSKPALATVGLFIALGYWNDWYNSFLFVDDSNYYSLQYYLYKMISAAEGLQRMARQGGQAVSVANLPQESFKMAMTVVATGPIVLLYPFVQKYFVKGITIGAVKG